MHLDHLFTGLLTGMVLIAFGVVPGLFQSFVEAVYHCIAVVHTGVPPSTAQRQVRQPAWLAILRSAFIAMSIYTYLSA
jgi:hypothetical protein